MKKLLFTVLAAVLLISCGKEQATDGYTIVGNIENFESGKKVFLVVSEDQKGFKKIDTTTIENGTFEFNGKTDEIQIGYIEIESVQMKIPFVLENDNITIKTFKDSIQSSIQGGSYNNEEFYSTNKHYLKHTQKVQKFEIENMELLKAAMEGDTIGKSAMLKDYDKLRSGFKDFMIDYVDSHPKSYMALVMLSQLIHDPEADMAKLRANYEALIPEIRATSLAKKVAEHMTMLEETIEKQKATEVGKMAPDFSAPNPEGNMVSLKESLGKVTIIDFWASWCGPCRKENPHLVAIYNEFNKKGLNIIGVSLDREGQKDKWVEAIATDKLTWAQVSNLKFWEDPIARQYGVQGIPATFILDETGKIVAKDLRGEQLRSKIAELLNK